MWFAAPELGLACCCLAYSSLTMLQQCRQQDFMMSSRSSTRTPQLHYNLALQQCLQTVCICQAISVFSRADQEQGRTCSNACAASVRVSSKSRVPAPPGAVSWHPRRLEMPIASPISAAARPPIFSTPATAPRRTSDVSFMLAEAPGDKSRAVTTACKAPRLAAAAPTIAPWLPC